MSDVNQNYFLDSRQIQNVTTPSYGSLQFTLPPFLNLNVSDSYLMSTFMVCSANSIANNGTYNDWQISLSTQYVNLVVAAIPATPVFTMYNPPTVIPSTGVITLYGYWSSRYVGYNSLHVDLTDISRGYFQDGFAYVNVSSPGSGVVIFTINNTAANPLPANDNVEIDWYMTQGNYTNALGTGQDYANPAASGAVLISSVPAAQLTNTVQIVGTPSFPGTMATPQVPTTIPLTGGLSVLIAWTTNIAGVMNVHLDFNDAGNNYAYDGGWSTQVVGPGGGVLTATVSYASLSGGNISLAEQYSMHVYLTPENNTNVYGPYVDYLHYIVDRTYYVYAAQPSRLAYPGAIYNAMSYYNPPSTIPSGGYLTVVVEYSSNCTSSATISVSVNDVSQSYLIDAIQTQYVSTPSYGSLQFVLPRFPTLASNESFLLIGSMVCYGTTNTIVNAYAGLSVATIPATPVFTMYNPPTIIPSTGVITLYGYWSSRYVGYLSLHVDLTDISQGYFQDGHAYVNVSSPGSGVIIFTINNTAANPLPANDNVEIDWYMTQGNYTTVYGPGQDYLYGAATGSVLISSVPAAQLSNTVQIVGSPSFPGTLAAPQVPTTIPLTGSLSVLIAWTSNYAGVVNVHLDFNDAGNNYAYDGGWSTQVVGPGGGVLTATVSYASLNGGNLTLGESYSMHVYLTPENSTQVFGGGVDYLHFFADKTYYVTAAQPRGLLYPGAIYNAMSYYNPPSTIPSGGYLTVVVEYSSNCTSSATISVSVNDVSQSYLIDAIQTQYVSTPSYGSLQFVLPRFPTLASNESFLLIGSMVCYGTTNTIVNAYAGLSVATIPATPVFTMYNPPTIIPSTGVITLYGYWSSRYVGYLSLHVDLTDISQGYFQDGHAYVNVSSPGSGVIIFTINNTAANPLPANDNVEIDWYMTQGNYTTVYGPGQDYLYGAATGSVLISSVPAAQLSNTVQIVGSPSFPGTLAAPQVPTTIPLTGSLSVLIAWTSNYAGVVNVHLDFNDAGNNYAYDGGWSTQVVGPGGGVLTATVSYASLNGGNLTLGESYSMHVYLTPENSTQVFGGGVDYLHFFADKTYYVTAAQPRGLLYPGAIYNAMSYYNPPSTIPSGGYLTVVVEYSSNCTSSATISVSVNDVSQSYLIDAIQTQYVSTPSYGSLQFVLPRFPTLASNESFLLIGSMVCYGTTNTIVNAYAGLSVATIPATPVFTMYNPPTIIPSTGVITLYGYWSSRYVGYLSLHVDLTDISQGYFQDGHAYVNVSSPGSGVIIFTINNTAANPLPANDNVEIDWYMTQGNYTTVYGPGNDWMYSVATGSVLISSVPAAQLTNSIQIVGTPSFPGTLAAPQVPTTIPLTGSLSVLIAWTTNYAGVVNVHLDFNDAGNNYAYDGGWSTQVVGPGGGVLTATVSYASLNGGNLTLGESYSMHVYLTPENSTQVFGGGVDYLHYMIDRTYYVNAAQPSRLAYPGAIYNALSYYSPPTTVPSGGYLTVVMEYSSNCSNSAYITVGVFDVSQSYVIDSIQTQYVSTPSYGSLQFVLPRFPTLPANETYLLISSLFCYGTTNAIVNAYQGLSVAAIPSTPVFTMYNPPTILPNTGVFTLYGYWSSAYVGYVSLHVDLTDITLGYVNDGHAYANVSSPGSGVVIFTMNITTAKPLPVSDSIMIDWYLTLGNYTTALGTGNDYLNQAASGNVPISSVAPTSLTNSIQIIGTPSFPGTVAYPQVPTTIPLTNSFSMVLAWTTTYVGVVNVHLDFNDATMSYAYDGGWSTQVIGPGGGQVTATVSYAAIGGNISLSDTYSMHVYLTPENTTQVFGGGVDYLHYMVDRTYFFTATQPSKLTYPGAIYNRLSYFQPPTTIPQNGFLTVVVEYSSNCTNSVLIHVEVSDVTQNYFLDSRQIQTIATPSYGSLQFVLPPFTNLNVSESYLMSAFMVCSAASLANGGFNNDWQISLSTAYQNLVVAAIPAKPVMTMYNPPTVLPNTGLFTLYGYWSSNYVGWLSLHVDLTDVTLGYVNDGHAYVNVSSPGSGVIIFPINITTASPLPVSDNIIIDWYMTQGNWTAALGTGNDYQNQAASGQVSISSIPASQLVNSIQIFGTPVNPGTVARPVVPTTIPLTGSFQIYLAWTTPYQGVMNVHVDLNDKSQNYFYDGGFNTQVIGPGGGTLTATLSYAGVGGNLTMGDTYTMHVYLTPENNTNVFGPTTDYLHYIVDQTYTVSVVTAWANYTGPTSSSSSTGGGTGGGITPPNPNPTIASASSSSKLSGGAIAGIVIGSIVGAALLLLILYVMWSRRDGSSSSYKKGGHEMEQSQHHKDADESAVEMSSAPGHVEEHDNHEEDGEATDETETA